MWKPTSVLSSGTASSARKAPSTLIAGAWLPLKKAVSISQPMNRAESTPTLIKTQSAGSGLCRRVSQLIVSEFSKFKPFRSKSRIATHPSYQAPKYVYLVLSRIGALGASKLAASAKNSSEQAIVLPPNFDPMTSTPS